MIFVDNKVDLVAMDGEQESAPALTISTEVHPNKPIGDFDPSADINIDLDAPSVHQKARTGFMTDKGSAFSLVAEHFGWTHLLDCRHFATQILYFPRFGLTRNTEFETLK